jgi:hypothetical protein
MAVTTSHLTNSSILRSIFSSSASIFASVCANRATFLAQLFPRRFVHIHGLAVQD